ncbi:MAG: small, acid-soluble spore protein, H family [Syntrophomonadaceae bacterium]|nr:small, acid-soluble spore protein, H family [Syntrophomonadaceae bacterium]
MDLSRLYEVMNLSTVAQVLYNDNLVRVESVNESENGNMAQIVYPDSGRKATVPVEQLKETSLPEAEGEYIFDASTRWSPLIRG